MGVGIGLGSLGQIKLRVNGLLRRADSTRRGQKSYGR
jgi:hypothetical protein